jgi:predicted DNA-binding protein with PD1-like motif
MTVTSSSARHILLRFREPARLPEALLGALRDEVVLAGWVRASGVLGEVQLRAFDARAGSPPAARRIAGPVHAVVLEGSVGLANGDVTCGMRAVLARETDSGLETIAGEIVEARIVALEAMVTALDDAAAARALDPTGLWLLDLGGGAPRAAPAAPKPPLPQPPQPPPAWAEAARASEETPAPPVGRPAPPKPSPTFTAAAIPQRPVKPAAPFEDVVYPDAGDVVEHFAFGRCEVVKSDGDRLHVRLGKDGRIKEISLDMLKTTPLPPEEGQTTRHFRLDRKL